MSGDKLPRWLAEPHVKNKEKRIRDFRREASRLASMANKRLQRLEFNKLTDVPAYQKLVDVMGDKPRFSVRGKDYNEVQREVARMRQFLNAKTSTVRGANQVLKEMAKNTGIKYKTLKDLKSKAKLFFELANKVEQYLRTVDDIASAIGYQKIWEAVNTYIQDVRKDLGSAELDLEKAIVDISDAIKEYEERIIIKQLNNPSNWGWYQLDND